MSNEEQEIQSKFDAITPEEFLGYLRDHGFTQFNRRHGAECPFAAFLKEKFKDKYALTVSTNATGFYKHRLFGAYGDIVAMAPHYPHNKQWVIDFVQQVDAGPHALIEGWQAAAIMENILRPRKPAPIPDSLSLVRQWTFDQYTKQYAMQCSPFQTV